MEKKIWSGHHVMEGAGVRLFRVFSNEKAELTDPFLLLDNFGSDDPEDYIKGFPWHPHRGIETVTYMLEGYVEHEDSLGNKGTISSGELQWMSAGSGIIHQEMPAEYIGMMRGLQLWVNLPKDKKMSAPRYRGILNHEIPIIQEKGLTVKVIAGKYKDATGPVKDLMVDIEYLDISLDHGNDFDYHVKKGYTTFCYVLEGRGDFEKNSVKEKNLILFKDFDKIQINAPGHVRFILVSGRPLKEPIAWGGPIVMNTGKELEQAFSELSEGTFIRK
ncbi:MAG: pirin family protein [Nanoarchaeota archaeon]|nr:pirin family protein [Nanoarchaeota archaeon]